MMRLDAELRSLRDDIEFHYATKSPIIELLRERFPDAHEHIHEILMPTPIGGASGPSLSKSLFNLFLPVGGATLPSRIASYLRAEAHLYDREHFDLAINDGDMGSNVIASRRSIPSIFVTNQYKPRLSNTKFYLRPAAEFISHQVAKATRILVADSAPPNCICEYNLNIPPELMDKVEFVGHFAGPPPRAPPKPTKLDRLIGDAEFGYWMRTGDASTNDATGAKYDAAFADPRMRGRRRLISHARADVADRVTDHDGRSYTIEDALDRGIDWLQIDIGFLSETDRQTVLAKCAYAVVNGSHTVLGEAMGANARPIIGVPVYDEHVNQIEWAQERGMGVLAKSPDEIAAAASSMLDSPGAFDGALRSFATSFARDGALRAARIASDMLEE